MLVKCILFLFLDAKGTSNHNSVKLRSHETNSSCVSAGKFPKLDSREFTGASKFELEILVQCERRNSEV